MTVQLKIPVFYRALFRLYPSALHAKKQGDLRLALMIAPRVA